MMHDCDVVREQPPAALAHLGYWRLKLNQPFYEKGLIAGTFADFRETANGV